MKWIIDRFEADKAVLEEMDTRDITVLARTALPTEAREGDVIVHAEGAAGTEYAIGAETPGAETPGAETSGAETPGAETSGGMFIIDYAETKNRRAAIQARFERLKRRR